MLLLEELPNWSPVSWLSCRRFLWTRLPLEPLKEMPFALRVEGSAFRNDSLSCNVHPSLVDDSEIPWSWLSKITLDVTSTPVDAEIPIP